MGLEKFIGNIADWSKASPRILLPLTIICGAFVFGDNSFFKTLGLEVVQAQYRPYFGFGFLLFGLLLISFPIAAGGKWFYTWLKDKYHQQKKEKQFIEWFAHLTPAQKKILRSFIEKDTRSLSLDYRDGTVNELMNAGIIYLPTKISFLSDGSHTDYNIQPWVYKYLKEHPSLLLDFRNAELHAKRRLNLNNQNSRPNCGFLIFFRLFSFLLCS